MNYDLLSVLFSNITLITTQFKGQLRSLSFTNCENKICFMIMISKCGNTGWSSFLVMESFWPLEFHIITMVTAYQSIPVEHCEGIMYTSCGFSFHHIKPWNLYSNYNHCCNVKGFIIHSNLVTVSNEWNHLNYITLFVIVTCIKQNAFTRSYLIYIVLWSILLIWKLIYVFGL